MAINVKLKTQSFTVTAKECRSAARYLDEQPSEAARQHTLQCRYKLSKCYRLAPFKESEKLLDFFMSTIDIWNQQKWRRPAHGRRKYARQLLAGWFNKTYSEVGTQRLQV